MRQENGVLALGRKLVEELELEPGVDTLGRWMAHHVAELIMRAETANDAIERADAEKQAVETILRIWNHRSAHSRINPFSDLESVLNTVRALSTPSPPWGALRSNSSVAAARRMYELLRLLLIDLTFIGSGGFDALDAAFKRAQETGEWQSDTEQELIEHLLTWLQTTQTGAEESYPESKRARSRKTEEREGQRVSVDDLRQGAIQIIAELEEILPMLRQTLNQPSRVELPQGDASPKGQPESMSPAP